VKGLLTSQQIRMTVFALIVCAAFAQNGPSSQGETALKTQFIAVQPDVKLEVVDWRGTGRNLVLLAGGGSTAHVFDSLGPPSRRSLNNYFLFADQPSRMSGHSLH
jgi:non-heme chloroperoxidase